MRRMRALMMHTLHGLHADPIFGLQGNIEFFL